jgi:hypothetical protein
MICHSKLTFVRTAGIGRLKMMCSEQDVSDLGRNQLSLTGRLKEVYFRRRLALQSGGSDFANRRENEAVSRCWVTPWEPAISCYPRYANVPAEPDASFFLADFAAGQSFNFAFATAMECEKCRTRTTASALTGFPTITARASQRFESSKTNRSFVILPRQLSRCCWS